MVLYYHGIPQRGNKDEIAANAFERQISFLKQHFAIVGPDRVGKKRNPLQKLSVMLTFDDGFRNHAAVVAPILRRFNVPAVFFVSSRHSIPGKYLWFSHLNALEKYFRGNGFYFRGEFIDMSANGRNASIGRLRKCLLALRPHPAAMYQVIEEELPHLEDFIKNREDISDCYAGMSPEQMGELAADPLFTVGVHTVDHPLLTLCEPNECFRQILENKCWIERTTVRQCETIAYPAGAYNSKILEQCRQLDFTKGYALTPQIGDIPELEQPRIGIFSASVDILRFKVQWGNLMRACGLHFG